MEDFFYSRRRQPEHTQTVERGDEEQNCAGDIRAQPVSGGEEYNGRGHDDSLNDDYLYGAAAEAKLVVDAVDDQDKDNVECIGCRERHARAPDAVVPVAEHDEEDEGGVVDQFHDKIDDGVVVGEGNVFDGRNDGLQKQIARGEHAHAYGAVKLRVVEYRYHERQQHEQRHDHRRHQQRANLYLSCDGVIAVGDVIADGGEPREVFGVHGDEDNARICHAYRKAGGIQPHIGQRAVGYVGTNEHLRARTGQPG